MRHLIFPVRLSQSALLALFLLASHHLQAQSALDGFDPNADDIVRVFVVQPDGKILIGGDFTTLSPSGGAPVTRNHLARLNPDGRLDKAFDPNVNGGVRSIAIQANGQIVVGGLFTTLSPNGGGAVTRNNIARLNSDGTLDAVFNPDAEDGGVDAIAVQADGQILAGGFFTTIGGQTRNYIARLDSKTGSADSFDPTCNDNVSAITVQPDGKILLGGSFTSIGGQTRNHIARLDPASGLADSFNPDANRAVVSIALQADGMIVAGGQFMNIGGQPRNRIARLDATTGLADSYNPMADNNVFSIAVQPDGMILVAGFFTTIGPTDFVNGQFGQLRNYIARLDPTTGLADQFDPNMSQPVFAVAVQSDGKVLAGGFFKAIAPYGGAAVTRNHIARLEIDGRVDQTLDLNLEGTFVNAVAVQPDGKTLISGAFTSVHGVPRNSFARLNTDGTVDTTFDPNPNGEVGFIVVLANGKILVGGLFSGANSIGGQTRNYIARLDPDGLADSFDPNPNNWVNSLAVQLDGKIVVAGFFIHIGGQARNFIARLDPNTGLADSFDPNSNSFSIWSVAVQADGKPLAGGGFTMIGGQLRNGIARLDPSTGLADSFDPNANNNVFTVSPQADGRIFACGNFSMVGGQSRTGIARLDPVTGLADSFDPDPGMFGRLGPVAVQSDGKILGGGTFDQMGGESRRNIARVDGASALADSFDPSANDRVVSITLQADGKVLTGGFFSGFNSIGGQTRFSFARLSNDTAATQDVVATRSAVTWIRSGSSPALLRATFEYSTDNINYTVLGSPSVLGSNWILGGLILPEGQNFYIRARGFYSTGNSKSASITERVQRLFLPVLTSTPTPTPTAAPTPTPSAAVLGNISTRLRVGTGDNALIGGFIVTGTQPKKVIVRAIGPSLVSVFPDALTDPILELRDSSGGLIRSNDNWQSNQAQEIIDSGVPPGNDLEAAIVATLAANGSAYTAIVRGVGEGTGVALVEAYDLDQTADSRLADISTRGLVQTGTDVMIAGTIIVGSGAQRVLVRAIGPSLPVEGKLLDPTLELRDANGTVIRSNDNWRSDQAQEIIDTTIPPTNDLESAIVATLPAGGAAYTAIVRGVNDTIGVALVEVYALNN